MGGTTTEQLLNSRINHSPIDTLISIKVRRRLCRKIPNRLDWHTVIHLRVTALRQRRAMHRGNLWWLELHTDVIEYFSDIGAVRDERNQAQLPWALRAQQRENKS
jgi:hypothetical protein